MIKGVIFDADGTLLDSMSVWSELGERYLAKHGIKAGDDLAKTLYPLSLSESASYLKKAYCLGEGTEEIVSDIVGMVRLFYLNDVVPKVGAVDYIRRLHERKIPMIVATSNDKDLLKSVFLRLGIDRCFRGVITCDEENTCKRDSAIYIKAAEILGTKPCETVVFEDVLHGILSAKNAGFLTVAVDDVSNRTETEKLRAAADYFIRDFTDSVLKKIKAKGCK